jgi:hypothetical protein
MTWSQPNGGANMRKLNCRPGELAIVISSFDDPNIGSIFKVLGRNAKACGKQFFWRIHAAHTLNYAKGDKQYRRRKGSLADADFSRFVATRWVKRNRMVEAHLELQGVLLQKKLPFSCKEINCL